MSPQSIKEKPKAFFGTDGIRGLANVGKLSPESLLNLGRAAGLYLKSESHTGCYKIKVLIGRDTRLSGHMVEAALVAGLASVGIDVELAGVIPTPAVALITRHSGFDMGIMITASHNKFQDNGVKFFDGQGCKISDEAEHKIETLLLSDKEPEPLPSESIGRVIPFSDAGLQYLDLAIASFPADSDISKLNIVLDCAHGAAFQVAPALFERLGADALSVIGVTPNGTNINAGCGSTHTALLAETVVAKKADIGIAFDGDADRLIMCDETGQMVDGDQLLALVTSAWSQRGQLSQPGLVATVMSNLGLERYIKNLGLEFIRTAVGDRHVAAKMRQEGYNIGGEQSGHILLSDFAPTGDGVIASLQVLAEIIRQDKPASEVLNVFTPVPQLLKNVRFSGSSPLENTEVQSAISQAASDLGDDGRVLVRASGTEPLIRVMAEGDNAAQVKNVVDSLVAVINNYAS